MVANLVLTSSSTPPNWSAASPTYRGISNHGNNRMGITASALKQLRAHARFSQIRFHCSKKSGTTIHLKTTIDSKGEAVVKYFSRETDVLPSSCDSFIRMEGDTSRLSTQCSRWGNDHAHYVGKWGHYNFKGEYRLYKYAAFVAHKYHWKAGQWICDDNTNDNLSSGDFWKIYVRWRPRPQFQFQIFSNPIKDGIESVKEVIEFDTVD